MEKQTGSQVDLINDLVSKNQFKVGMNNSSSQSFHTTTAMYLRNSAGNMDQMNEFSVPPEKSKNGPSDDHKESIKSSVLVEDKDRVKNVYSEDVKCSNGNTAEITKNNKNSCLNGKSNITEVSSPVENDIQSTVLNPLSFDLLHELVPEVGEKSSSANHAHETLCNLVSNDPKPKNVAENFTLANKEKRNLYLVNDLDDILKCPQFVRTEKKHYSNDAVNLDELDMSLSKILNSAKTGSIDCIGESNRLVSGISNSKVSNVNGDHTYHLPYPCVETNGINTEATKLVDHSEASESIVLKAPGSCSSNSLSVNKHHESLSESSKCLRTSTTVESHTTSADPETQTNSSLANQTTVAAKGNSAIRKVFTDHKDSPKISNLSSTTKDLTPNEIKEVSLSEENILNGNTSSHETEDFASENGNVRAVAVESDDNGIKEEENEELPITKVSEFPSHCNQPKSSTTINPSEGLNKMKHLLSNDKQLETLIIVNASEGLKGTKCLLTGENRPETSMNFTSLDESKEASSTRISENGDLPKETGRSSCEVKSNVSTLQHGNTGTKSDVKCAVEKPQVLTPSSAELSPVPDTSYDCNECGARLKTQNSLFTHKKMHLSVLAVTGLINKRRLEETDKGNANTEEIVKPKRGRPRLNKTEGPKAISTTLKENIPKKIRRTRAQASEKSQMKSKEITKAVKDGKTVNRGEPLKSSKNLRLRESSVLVNKNKTKSASKSEGLKSINKNLSNIEAAKPDARMRSYTPSITGNLMRKFACVECGAKFKRNDHLKRHQLLHSEKGFQCTQCDMKFYRGDKLKLHTLRHHTNPSAKTVAPKTVVVHQSVLKITKLPKRNVECQKCGFQFLRIVPPKTDKSGLSRRKNSCCISCGAKLPEDDN